MEELHRQQMAISLRSSNMSDEMCTLPPKLAEELDGIIESLKAFQQKVNQRAAPTSATGLDDFCKKVVKGKLAKPKSKCDHTMYGRQIGVSCMVSKEDTGKPSHFWYTFRRKQVTFLNACQDGYVIFICKTEDNVLRTPWGIFQQLLRQIEEDDGRWQIHIKLENNRYKLRLNDQRKPEDLTEYRFIV